MIEENGAIHTGGQESRRRGLAGGRCIADETRLCIASHRTRRRGCGCAVDKPARSFLWPAPARRKSTEGSDDCEMMRTLYEWNNEFRENDDCPPERYGTVGPMHRTRKCCWKSGGPNRTAILRRRHTATCLLCNPAGLKIVMTPIQILVSVDLKTAIWLAASCAEGEKRCDRLCVADLHRLEFSWLWNLINIFCSWLE